MPEDVIGYDFGELSQPLIPGVNVGTTNQDLVLPPTTTQPATVTTASTLLTQRSAVTNPMGSNCAASGSGAQAPPMPAHRLGSSTSAWSPETTKVQSVQVAAGLGNSGPAPSVGSNGGMRMGRSPQATDANAAGLAASILTSSAHEQSRTSFGSLPTIFDL